jgi:hypothetical protein
VSNSGRVSGSGYLVRSLRTRNKARKLGHLTAGGVITGGALGVALIHFDGSSPMLVRSTSDCLVSDAPDRGQWMAIADLPVRRWISLGLLPW